MISYTTEMVRPNALMSENIGRNYLGKSSSLANSSKQVLYNGGFGGFPHDSLTGIM